nr:hypothetical protein [uncultured Desulfobacter sp.]
MEHVVRNLIIKILEQGYLPSSAVSKSAHSKIQQFRDAGFISWEKAGRGGRYILIDRNGLKKLLKATGYHGSSEGLTPKAKAVSRHCDAHAGNDHSLVIHISIKGNGIVWRKNGVPVDINSIVKDCGMASIVVRPEDEWETDSPIALVENIDLLVYAKEYFADKPFQGNILYYAGWTGAKTIDWLGKQALAPEIIFPDYDFVGLKNYLKLKNHFPGLRLHIPAGLPELVKRFGNKEKFVKQSLKYSLEQSDEDVKAIYAILQRYGKSLDQEGLLLAAL